MRALLDINVMIALLDGQHSLHSTASQWLSHHAEAGWASCPISQNGVIRIVSQPSYPNAQPPAAVASRLAEACRHPSHKFWGGALSLLDPRHLNWHCLLGPRQITDAYLLAVAVANDGCLVSFDRRIHHDLVPSARPDTSDNKNQGTV